MRLNSSPPSQRLPRSNHRRYYSLAPSQFALIDDIWDGLPSAAVRNSFRLRVALALRLAAPLGPVRDELLRRAIDKTLAEIGAAP